MGYVPSFFSDPIEFLILAVRSIIFSVITVLNNVCFFFHCSILPLGEYLSSQEANRYVRQWTDDGMSELLKIYRSVHHSFPFLFI